jgi:hypothetical protein
MTDPAPQCPAWAANQGLPVPAPGEPFRVYWKRVGAPEDDICFALSLPERAIECANMRMAAWLLRACPGLFDDELNRLLVKHRITPKSVPRAPQGSPPRSSARTV